MELKQDQRVSDLDGIIKKLQPFLRRYLEERNVLIDKGWFRCINPAHEDRNPSCSIGGDYNEEVFHCFSCGTKGIITHAAYLLEGKPISGPEFIKDNVLYLADKYGIEYGVMQLTPEELHKRRIYQIYEDAADIISTNQPLEYIVKRKWPVTLCRELQIGTVKSYNSFITTLLNRGYERKLIDEVDLNRYIFNEGMLVFTVRDHLGRVVGFSARNMSHSKDSKKMKFINTSSKCPIYSKSSILYGLHVAKREKGPIYIFEGYPDFATAYKYGMRNVCAIGGTALTRDHIDIIKNLGIRDIILALDGDDAGQNRTERILDEYFSSDETIRVRILKLPADKEKCDPDDFIEYNSIDEFKKLPIFTPFQWRLDRFPYDAKAEDISDKMMPMILNDPDEVHREAMARQLSERTDIRLKTILKQLDKLLNIEDAKIDSQVQHRIRQVVDDLRFHRSDPVFVLESAIEEIRQIHSVTREDLHASNEFISFIDEIKETFSKREPGLHGWRTGFSMFDEAMSGIPKEDVMITFAGDSNVGKTGFMFELALRLAKNNKDIMVLFMSIDDSRQQAIARLVALESGLRINQVSHPSENIKTDEDKKRLRDGWKTMRNLVETNKFSLKDNNHGNTLDFAEGWIRWAKDNYPDKEVVFFLDNFHKLGDEWAKEERIRFKHASARMHTMKNKLHFTAICTMEIRKLMGAQRNQRPILQDISESKQMEYDNNMIGMIYSDIHAKRHDAKIFWTEDGPDGVSKKPVIEVDIQKNKISMFKDTLYYKFSPEYSKFYECDKTEVQMWRREYEDALRIMKDKIDPDAGKNPFVSSSEF